MTPDKNFRMKQSTKRMLASMDSNDRNSYKKSMIDAQLCEEAAQRASLKSKERSTAFGGKNNAATGVAI